MAAGWMSPGRCLADVNGAMTHAVLLGQSLGVLPHNSLMLCPALWKALFLASWPCGVQYSDDASHHLLFFSRGPNLIKKGQQTLRSDKFPLGPSNPQQ